MSRTRTVHLNMWFNPWQRQAIFLFQGIKRPGRETGHLPYLMFRIRVVYIVTTLPIRLHDMHRYKLIFTLPTTRPPSVFKGVLPLSFLQLISRSPPYFSSFLCMLQFPLNRRTKYQETNFRPFSSILCRG